MQVCLQVNQTLFQNLARILAFSAHYLVLDSDRILSQWPGFRYGSAMDSEKIPDRQKNKKNLSCLLKTFRVWPCLIKTFVWSDPRQICGRSRIYFYKGSELKNLDAAALGNQWCIQCALKLFFNPVRSHLIRIILKLFPC